MPTAASVLEQPPVGAAATTPAHRRALLFFLSAQQAYRSPLFSPNEIFCGPDTPPRLVEGRVRALRTAAGSFDIREILRRIPAEQQPDFLVVKADATGRNLPRHLSAVQGPKVLLVGDTHHLSQPIQSLIRYAQEEPFDFVIFDHTRHHARFFAEAGLRNLFWLPALDYGFEPRELRDAPSHPLTFVGQAGRFHPWRCHVLEQVKAAGLPLELLRGRLSETADFYADSQITLNISLNGDLNLRVFEALAAGGFLLTDQLSPESGLARLFASGRHLETWRTPGELVEKIRHYLAHPAEAQRIRREGQAELIRHHHPDVKLKEFYALLDGGAPHPRYDLRTEPWWPSAAAKPSPAFFARVAAYEQLQETHRVSSRVALFAEAPGQLTDFANLPRLEVRPLGELRLNSPGAVLWWTDTTPEPTLTRFAGDLILAPDAGAAAIAALSAWGFEPAADDSAVLRLSQPMRFLAKAWEAEGREAVRARLPALIAAARNALEAVALADYARQIEDPRLQHEALKRAIGLDRNDLAALLGLAALMVDHGDLTSVAVLLEEAARIAPLPPGVEALRRELAAGAAQQKELEFYYRAIGRVPPVAALRPRRVLLITNLFPPQELGGYGRMMWEFAQGLVARGHDVQVLCADQPALAKAPTPDEAALEARVRRVLPLLGEWQGGKPVMLPDKAARNARVSQMIATIHAAGAEFHPDLVLAGNLDFLDIIPLQVALAAGVPVLHALGNQTPGYSPGAQPTSPRYWVGPSSDWNGEILRQNGFAPARIETLYPGARIDRFFRFFLPDTSRLRICFAGLVLPYKGPHVLVDALERLHRAGVDFTAEIAGDCPDPAFLGKLQDAVKAVGIADRVSFTGFLDRAGLSALFARSNVLVFPSQVPETFGISQVEAMAAGLVVLTSGMGGAREVIRHGIDGLVFPAQKAEELAQQLLSLARDPEQMGRLQRAGQARAVAFAVEHSVEKIERLMEELLAVPEAGHAPSMD
jgi:glycosyltransferase involved in cell wall biosynthesis